MCIINMMRGNLLSNELSRDILFTLSHMLYDFFLSFIQAIVRHINVKCIGKK